MTYSFLNPLKKSLQYCKNSWQWLPLSFLLDILFFYALTRLHVEIFTKMSSSLLAMTAAMDKATTTLSETELINIESYLTSTPDFMTQYDTFLQWLVVFFLGSFTIWIVFQGINWFLAHHITKNNVPFFKYVRRFTLSSIAWFILFIIVMIILVMLMDVSLSTLPIIGETESNIIIGILSFTLWYIAVVSYSINSLKKTFSFATKHIKTLGTHFIILTALFGIILFVAKIAFNFDWWLLLLFTLLIVVPYITLTRVYFIVLVKSLNR